MLAMFLMLTAGISAAVANYVYQSNLKTFFDQRTAEEITALQLVDAFVTTYSRFRSEFGQSAPVPATFPARLDKYLSSYGLPLLGWGASGREIWLKDYVDDGWQIMRLAGPQAKPEKLSKLPDNFYVLYFITFIRIVIIMNIMFIIIPIITFFFINIFKFIIIWVIYNIIIVYFYFFSFIDNFLFFDLNIFIIFTIILFRNFLFIV